MIRQTHWGECGRWKDEIGDIFISGTTSHVSRGDIPFTFHGEGITITPSLQSLHISHVGGERGDVLGLLALRGHDVVAPAAAVDAVDAAVPPEGGVASHRPGVVLGGSTLIIFLTTPKKRQTGNAHQF